MTTWARLLLTLVNKLGSYPLLLPTVSKGSIHAALCQIFSKYLAKFHLFFPFARFNSVSEEHYHHQLFKFADSVEHPVLIISKMGCTTCIHFSFWAFTLSCMALKLRQSSLGFVRPKVNELQIRRTGF